MDLPRMQATGRSPASSGSAGTVPSLAPHLGALTGYMEALRPSQDVAPDPWPESECVHPCLPAPVFWEVSRQVNLHSGPSAQGQPWADAP